MFDGQSDHRRYGMDGLTVVAGLDPAAAGCTAMVVVGLDRRTGQRWVLDVNYRAQYLAGGSAYVTAAGLVSKGTEGDHWEHQVRVGLRWNIW